MAKKKKKKNGEAFKDTMRGILAEADEEHLRGMGRQIELLTRISMGLLWHHIGSASSRGAVLVLSKDGVPSEMPESMLTDDVMWVHPGAIGGATVEADDKICLMRCALNRQLGDTLERGVFYVEPEAPAALMRLKK
jgi:hypothetical protein